jgi:DNA polymerase iota
MPNFVFNLHESPSLLADKLVEEALVPMFRKLHHEKGGWNLSLINIAATNMAETAAESKDSKGRDIGKMFRQQDDVLKDFKVTSEPAVNDNVEIQLDIMAADTGGWAMKVAEPGSLAMEDWESEDGDSQPLERCEVCQSAMPRFALAAHRRFHEAGN